MFPTMQDVEELAKNEVRVFGSGSDGHRIISGSIVLFL